MTPILQRSITAAEARFPTVAMLAAVALAPVGAFAPLAWAVGSVVIALAGLTVIMSRPPRPAWLDIGLWLGFVAYGAASLAWSDARRAGLGMLGALAGSAVVYLAARTAAHDPAAFATARRAATAITALAGAALILQWVAHPIPDGIAFDYPTRHLAMASTATAAIGLATSRARRLPAAATLLALAGSLVTGSRTATAALLIVLVAMVTPRLSWRSRVGAGVALVILLVAAATVPSVRDRFLGTVTSGSDAGIQVDAGGRTDVWRAVHDRCGLSTFGAGLGTANVVANRFHPGFPDPHNEALRFGCDVGLVGSALMWGALAFFALRMSRLVRARPGHRVGLAGLVTLFAALGFALVWNPFTALEFMAPVAVLWGFADHAAARALPAATAPSSGAADRFR